MMHKEQRVTRRGGEQPHGGADALMHRGVDGLLNAAPVLRVLGVGVAVAEVQRRDGNLVGRLFGFAAGEAGGAVRADEDRGVGKGLGVDEVRQFQSSWRMWDVICRGLHSRHL